MQPLYEDQFGILALASGRPVEASTEPVYGTAMNDAKPLSWFAHFKRRYLFRINVLKLYQAYVFRKAKAWRSRRDPDSALQDD